MQIPYLIFFAAVTFQIKLDTDFSVKENKRVEFKEGETPTYVINNAVTLTKDVNSCSNYQIYVKVFREVQFIRIMLSISLNVIAI